MPTAAALAVVLAVAVLLIWIGQRRLIYFPDRDVPAPASVGLPGVEPVVIPREDGGTLRGWFLAAPKPDAFTVIVFNGNAGNRAYRAPLAAALRARGCAVLLFDYRGFGDSAGAPTQAGLEADAGAVRDYLVQRPDVRADRLVYFGESLGTAVAVALAVNHPPAALILRSPFTSMTDVGRFQYPVQPVRRLLRDRFASVDRIAKVRSPVLVVAGDRDSIVPLDLSRRLFEQAAAPKEMVVVEWADHNDLELLNGDRLIGAMMRFLERFASR
jgi:fermentation-respiration switch protein FrsA (DUF1100 family)